MAGKTLLILDDPILFLHRALVAADICALLSLAGVAGGGATAEEGCAQKQQNGFIHGVGWTWRTVPQSGGWVAGA